MSPAGNLCGKPGAQHTVSIISFEVPIYPNDPVSVARWVKKQKQGIQVHFPTSNFVRTFKVVSTQCPTLQDGPDKLATETFVDRRISQRTFWKTLS